MTDLATAPALDSWSAPGRDVDFARYVKRLGDGEMALPLLVEGVHCGGCIRKIRIFRILNLRDTKEPVLPFRVLLLAT